MKLINKNINLKKIFGFNSGAALVAVLCSALCSCSGPEPTPDPTQDEIEKKWPSVIDTKVVGKMIKVQRDTLGNYVMGTDEGSYESAPAHKVTFSKSFYIAEFELTQAEWTAIMTTNPSEMIGDSLPVERVSYSIIYEFINKLNEQTGRTFRLPTEAEWEYAARGGFYSNGTKYSGSDNLDEVGWYIVNNPEELSHKVGTKAPNEIGLYDMSGNVAELCSDKNAPYTADPQIDPASKTGSKYNVRGGWFDQDAEYCDPKVRATASSTDNFYNMGFRLLMEAPLDSDLLP
ncbi:MAG: hypothetical protein EOL95_00280 [Bacteroidia bacterium]|nr:hypothetical protein [Bacteroidia bacterium]